jgi:hypothetical protein
MPRKYPPEFKRDVVMVSRRGDLSLGGELPLHVVVVDRRAGGLARPAAQITEATPFSRHSRQIRFSLASTTPGSAASSSVMNR